MANKKPTLLCILDGFGIGDKNNPNNAIAKANTPNLDRILQEYPYSSLKTSGLDVGLPDGQIGNSEVGHNALGAGRIFSQGAKLVNEALQSGSVFQGSAWKKIVDMANKGGTVHFIV